jgi:hypothetical protein
MIKIRINPRAITIGLSILLCIQIIFISYNIYCVEKKLPNNESIKFTVKKTKQDNNFSIDCYTGKNPIFSITLKDGNLLDVTLNGHYYTRRDLEID